MALGANFRGRYLDFSDAKHPHASSCTSSNTCEQLGFQVSDHGALIPPNASARRAAYFRPNLLRTRVKKLSNSWIQREPSIQLFRDALNFTKPHLALGSHRSFSALTRARFSSRSHSLAYHLTLRRSFAWTPVLSIHSR